MNSFSTRRKWCLLFVEVITSNVNVRLYLEKLEVHQSESKPEIQILFYLNVHLQYNQDLFEEKHYLISASTFIHYIVLQKTVYR